VRTFEPDHHRDLRAEDPPPPSAGGGDALGRIAARLHADIEAVTDRTVADIREGIDAYRTHGLVPRDDLWWSVHRNIELVLRRIADGRPPPPDELAVRRELGIRRAQQGFPLTDLLRAFRLGYLTVWNALIEQASADGPAAVAQLAQHAALVWGTMDAVSSAVADGYRFAMEAADVEVRRRMLGFVSALREARSGEAAELATSLGLDPSGPFSVAVCLGHRQRFDADGIVVAEEPDRTVVLSTGADAGEGGDARLARLLLDHGAGHVGTGVGRHGVEGAAHSLREATLAHRTALELGRPVVRFSEAWFDCLVVNEATSLGAVLSTVVEHLAADPDAAATVDAVLAADGNLTAAARAMNLHPNGVAYRVDRLAERTGLDVRTSVSIRNAYAALALASVRRAPDGLRPA
jgi:hypothetical protein